MSLSAVTHYAVAVTLLTYFSQLMTSIFGVAGPILNKYHKLDQWDDLRKAFLVITELSTILAVLIGGLLMLLGRPFIQLWLGYGYEDVYIVLLILSIGSILGNAQRGCIFILFAVAKHKYLAYLNIMGTIIILAMALIFVKFYGIYGVALGVLIAPVFIQLIFLPIYTCKVLELPKRIYYIPMIKMFSVGISIFIFMFLVFDFDNVHTYLELVLMTIMISSIYLLITIKYTLSVSSKNRLLENIPNKFMKIAKTWTSELLGSFSAI